MLVNNTQSIHLSEDQLDVIYQHQMNVLSDLKKVLAHQYFENLFYDYSWNRTLGHLLDCRSNNISSKQQL